VDDRSPQGPPSTIDFLELVSYLMDRLFTVPGTDKRFGLNSLMLLVPILGDILPTLISFGILAVGLSHYRVPRIVAARMVLNSLLDASISWIPVLGNLWDFYFKADTRNVNLLKQYVGRGGEPPPSTWQHWLFVVGLMLLLLLFLTLLVLGFVALVNWLLRASRGDA
jgi:hypothetical protein